MKKKQNSPANEKQEEEEENMYMPVYVRVCVCVAVRALIDVHRTFYVHNVVLCINIYARHLIINTHLAPALAIDHNNNNIWFA